MLLLACSAQSTACMVVIVTQVAFIYSFTMRPYSNMRQDAPRTNID